MQTLLILSCNNVTLRNVPHLGMDYCNSARETDNKKPIKVISTASRSRMEGIVFASRLSCPVESACSFPTLFLWAPFLLSLVAVVEAAALAPPSAPASTVGSCSAFPRRVLVYHHTKTSTGDDARDVRVMSAAHTLGSTAGVHRNCCKLRFATKQLPWKTERITSGAKTTDPSSSEPQDGQSFRRDGVRSFVQHLCPPRRLNSSFSSVNTQFARNGRKNQ